MVEPFKSVEIRVPDLESGSFFLGSGVGSRGDMQDRYFFTECGLRNRCEGAKVLCEQFTQAARETARHTTGSTGTVAILTPDGEVTIAHLGDSPAMLFSLSLHGFFGVDLIRPHLPEDPREKGRILQSGGKVFAGKMWNDERDFLSMSRAFGDAQFKGVSRDPEISLFSFRNLAPRGGEAFLCIGTDGIVHPDLPQSAPVHASLIKKCTDFSFDARGLNRHLMMASMLPQESDNTTLFVLKVPSKISRAMAFGVFDGHGGEQTAQSVAERISYGIRSASPVRSRFAGSCEVG